MVRTKEGRKQELQVATRDYTLNMHKRLQGIAFKKRATRAVREIKRFAAKEMHTSVSNFVQNVMSCFGSCLDHIQYSIFWFLTHFYLLHRMSELTLNWTDSSGLEESEMYQEKLESESVDRRTKMRRPRKSSIAHANSSRLSPLPLSKPRIDDQSNSCYSRLQILNLLIINKYIFDR